MKKIIVTIIITILILLTCVGYLYFRYLNPIGTNEANLKNRIINEVDENNTENEIVIDVENNIITEEKYNENKYEGDFELPINGTTGFASVTLPLYDQINGNKISSLKPGQGFKILSESGDYFYIELSDSTNGYVESKYILVNLPDLIPSIIYDDTNSYSSIFRSSGYNLENITGKALYNVNLYNKRFDRNEFVMPLLYTMAKKIAQVQKEALKNDDCLKIYETYRPYDVQMDVSKSLSNLMDSNETVKAGITTPPWDKSWFIAVQLSNHQRGVALDVSLCKVNEKEYNYCGKYIYFDVTKYEEYTMPTKMHELSKSAATFTSPVNSKSKTDWKNARLASSMTSGSIKLQKYFTSFDLTPLASEWWHFNDLDARELTKNNSSAGKYFLTECYSDVVNGDGVSMGTEDFDIV